MVERYQGGYGVEIEEAFKRRICELAESCT